MSKNIIKFLICGSVDDGKSTLLGKLLFETKKIYQDQFEEIKIESHKFGSQGNKTDLALITDGLQSEREQGITIDVAYKYFKLKNKKYIVADTPGHSEYTKNMITGASNSDFAFLIIDATKGISQQTKLCALIISILRLKKIIVVINKMDLLKFDFKSYNLIKQKFNSFLNLINFFNVEYVPVSALSGENVVSKSKKMKWYKGKTLLKIIQEIDNETIQVKQNLSMGVQLVSRENTKRLYCGKIFSGEVAKGEKVAILPSEQINYIKKIFYSGKEVKKANHNQSVSFFLKNNTDLSRGNFIIKPHDSIRTYSTILGNIFWMDKSNLVLDKRYIIKFVTNICSAKVNFISFKYDKNFNKIKSNSLKMNEIGFCKINLNKKIPLTVFNINQDTGSFILIDEFTKNTVGAGVIENLQEQEKEIYWQNLENSNKQYNFNTGIKKPVVLWFTGLSASGKSTIASLVQKELNLLNKKNYLLDGDNIRHGLCNDLNFTLKDRKENIRRIAEVSKLMVDAGLITLVSFISPIRAERNMARSLLNKGQFIEIFVNTSLKTCEKRDFKGLYKKARIGKLKNFTGISSPYEKPINCEINLNSEKLSPQILAKKVIGYLKKHHII